MESSLYNQSSLEKGIHIANLLTSNLKEDIQTYVIPPTENQTKDHYQEKPLYDLNDGLMDENPEELAVIEEGISQGPTILKTSFCEPEYKGHFLKKEPIDSDFTPRKGKNKEKTSSRTASASQSSTTATSRDSDQKNKFSEWCSFDFDLNSSYQVDDQDKKELSDDIIPDTQDSYVKKFLRLPKGGQEIQLDVIADQFHNLLKVKDFKNPNFQILSRRMKVLRYWQAFNKGFEELNLHRLTSIQFKIIIRWVLKRVGEKIKKKECFPKKIEIVCGLGNHNNDGISRIGPKLDDFLKEEGIATDPPDNNLGARIVNIMNSSNALLFSQYASGETCK